MTNTMKLLNLFSNIEAAYDDTIVYLHAEYTAPEFCHDENVTMPGDLEVVACYADGATEVLYAVDTDEYGHLDFTATWYMSCPGAVRFVYTAADTGVVVGGFYGPVDEPVDGFDIQDDDSLPF